MTLQLFASIVAGVISIIFWLTSFIILYHLTRFGIGTLPKKLSALFLIGAVGLFSISFLIYAGIDFNAIRL